VNHKLPLTLEASHFGFELEYPRFGGLARFVAGWNQLFLLVSDAQSEGCSCSEPTVASRPR
jgi:hypothetical protein